MRRFQHEFEVSAPIEKVAAFHGSSQALKQLTPPPLFVKFNSIEPLGEGSRADFTLWLGPLPIHWVAVHSGVKPLEGFTDTQIEGPFSIWIHEHKFRRLSDERTLIVDRVQGQPSGHFFWGLISRFMWLTLPFLFFYRARQTRKSV